MSTAFLFGSGVVTRLRPILFTLALGQAIFFCRLPLGTGWQATNNDGLPHGPGRDFGGEGHGARSRRFQFRLGSVRGTQDAAAMGFAPCAHAWLRALIGIVLALPEVRNSNFVTVQAATCP